MATVVKPLSEIERAEREETIAEAIASVRLEGLEPSDEAKSIFGRYVSGELTIEEMSAEIQTLNARRSRPVHLSRD